MKAGYRLAVSVTAAAILAFGAPATSHSRTMDKPMTGQHGEGRGPMPGLANMDRMDDMMGMCLEHADKIGLTGDQVARIKPIHNEMQKKQARFKADLKIAEIEMMEIMEAKDFDLEKAGAAVRKIADIRTTHHLEMLKSMREVRTLLTDEQFGKMKKMMHMKGGGKRPAGKMMKKA